MADDAPHHLSLCFDYESQRRARIVERSVGVEVGEIDDARSTARVERELSEPTADESSDVRVRIDADDLVALRAGTNTWVRLLDVAETVEALAAGHRDD